MSKERKDQPRDIQKEIDDMDKAARLFDIVAASLIVAVVVAAIFALIYFGF